MKEIIQPHFNTTRFSYYFIKRFLDIIVSILLIIILSPMFLMMISVIFLSSGRPIIYKWLIVGFKGKLIKSYKFRTMIINADNIVDSLQKKNEMRGPIFKIKDDQRVTREGKIFRKFSMDESIQLFSILKGDMSLVGPRPPLQSEWARYNSNYKQKLTVKPGLTGLWQVSGRNRISDFDDVFSLDMEYIENWSLWLDIKILLLTIPAIIKGTGY